MGAEPAMPPAGPGLEALGRFPRRGVAGRGLGAPRRPRDTSGPPGSGPLMRGSHRPSWRKLCPPNPPGCGLLHRAGESRGPLCPSPCPWRARGRGGCRSGERSGPARPGAVRGRPCAPPVALAGGAAVSLPAAGRTAKVAAAKPCPALPAARAASRPHERAHCPQRLSRHREPRGASEPLRPFPVVGGVPGGGRGARPPVPQLLPCAPSPCHPWPREGGARIPSVLRECRGGQWLSTPRTATWSPAGEVRLPGLSTPSYPQILS